MSKSARQTHYPEFSANDFINPVSLLRKLKETPDNPIYQNLSEPTKALFDAAVAGNAPTRSIKNALCSDFNEMAKNLELYNKLCACYGRGALESKLSERTKQYKDSLEFISKPLDEFDDEEYHKEQTLMQWLNIYVLSELYPDEIRQIKQKGQIREWTEAIIIAVALAVFVRTFFFQIYKIPTTSMVPTLMPGDKIFVSKLVYGPKIPFTSLRIHGFGKPRHGDVVVFLPPKDRQKFYIKRLIARGGDRLLIKDGNLYLNGKIMTDPRIARSYYYNQGDYGKEGQEIVVPQGKYFFLGDNSLASSDSRFWGFADEKDIVGKAIFLWWPPKRIGMIE
ncbi:MAG: signal peptidase I [Candidatus Omnitrophica bacterium]|nr:signal peptidase I [Candidatus Omnitrophota bacterium]